MLIPSHSAKSLRAMCYTALCARMCLEKSNAAGLSRDLKRQIFRLGKKKQKKKQCAVSRHLSNVTLEGGPSNLQLFFFFPLPETLCLSSEPQGWRDKNGKRPVRKAGACIFHGLAHVRPALAACPLLPPRRSFIMPSHTHTHTQGAREEAQLMYLCCAASFSGKEGDWGHCIISWFLYAQNTSSALTSSPLALSYLH